MGKSKFVVFEGVDFCGKTTQLDHAEAFLKRQGRNVARFREPGGTATGERIRELLLDKERVEMIPKTEVLLFFASRVQLLEEKILPALMSGKTALVDRYYYSTAAYQGPFMQGFGIGWVTALAEDWLRLPEPDLVIYLDGDPENLASRKTGKLDRIEARGIEFQKKVRGAYLSMAERRMDLFRVVNAEQPEEVVKKQIEEILIGEVVAVEKP